MSWIKGDNKQEQKHFNYLETLRQSGVINMWGAASWLKNAFPKDFEKQKAGTVLVRWMQLHEDPSRVLEKEPK